MAGAHRAREHPEEARANAMSASSGRRLTEIDSLRGMAALAVLSFHFTTRYEAIYRFSGYLPFHAPWGYLGVNLFFVISGFVIYMTLDRTDVGADFLVSRFSRLYPAYWAAIALTFCITSVLGLPGKAVPWHIAVLNIPMFQMLFFVPMVDGVYWTLLVELLFYGLAYALFAARRMNYVLHALCALFALRLVYWGFAEFAHVDLPWRIRQLLILDYIPFFGLGIVAFRLSQRRGRYPLADLLTAMLAIGVLAVGDSALLAAVALGCFAAVWLAAQGRLGFLRFPLLVWLGTISYPLYLLHEYIGWSLLRQFQRQGLAPMAAIAVTTTLVIGLAAVVSKLVEYPGMAYIRRKYRESRQYRMRHAST
jgi:peptidoglycan/LPS O-acetylase OafA/YrhL